MPWNTALYGTPLNIAAYLGKQLRVVAGPGTGKTYALMRRVARLLEQNVQPNHILAISLHAHRGKRSRRQVGPARSAGRGSGCCKNTAL